MVHPTRIWREPALSGLVLRVLVRVEAVVDVMHRAHRAIGVKRRRSARRGRRSGDIMIAVEMAGCVSLAGPRPSGRLVVEERAVGLTMAARG